MFKRKIISKDTRDWAEEQDDDGFIELTPKDSGRDIEEDLGIPIAFKEPKKDSTSVRNRLEKISGVNVETKEESLNSVRSRLESLQNQRTKVPKPLEPKFFPEKQETKKQITPETVMQGKIEKAMSRVEELQRKMHESPGSYLSLFYDLKKAESNFLELLSEIKEKQLAISGTVLTRIEKVKAKIRNVKI